jgi:hypothetical protein|tara:strand:+ start:279 stop:476 length:198 start_codon:yes stop_codon:yes gene_type:complete
MKPQSTSSYDVDNRYRFYKSLNSKEDISPERRGVRPGVDNSSSKNFLNGFIDRLRIMNFPRQMID